MCVPLVTDETIERGEMIVDSKGTGIEITINDADGYLVSKNVYGFKAEDTYPTEVKFYRILNKGQIWPIKLAFKWKEDYSSMAGPTIVATGIGNLTKHEVEALLNVVANGEYKLSDTKLTKYGLVESYTFKDTPVVIEEDSFTPMDEVRFEKAKEMANSLIA